MEDVLAALTAALARGEAVAMVTIVAAHGSTPQRVGAKMLVFSDGRMVGTIGGGCYENDAFWKAREALGTRRSRLVHYELSDDLAEESGLICGGQMDVFIEPIEPRAAPVHPRGRPRRLSAWPDRAHRRLSTARRRRPAEVRQPRALPRRRRSRRREPRPVGDDGARFPPRPTSWCSHAATGRTSTCCGRCRAAPSAMSA